MAGPTAVPGTPHLHSNYQLYPLSKIQCMSLIQFQKACTEYPPCTQCWTLRWRGVVAGEEWAGMVDSFPQMAAVICSFNRGSWVAPQSWLWAWLQDLLLPKDNRKYDASRIGKRLCIETWPLLLLVGVLTPPDKEFHASLLDNERPHKTEMSTPGEASLDKPACQSLDT